ncbi:MAG: hypothetical protein HRU72_05510 [Planctomycetia bacterium]|uniref:Uncharacterized protein n=1 Tax=Candidatus Brocadia sapporoensis TaxID=392547 RepID=A0A1V6M3M2_9BACT|nr:hypothetical protein [Candidatus Brocadia sapporoensis]MCC7238265.1 hypothetical protein [Candidatus Brocadia sp.]QOJ06044.1 MAG: hypothetical protein HRU72_05510 [Planctomycetia bacterium]TVL94630.1 MAG: hypothetical protein CV082_14160 [Candidatus Brocadia sp. BL1]OQD47024.1 hypothetical protein BIY37_00125 [Candidatus Brocadia sapporoensis]HQU32524.1 hypothetical protein [Candidatus Brocadia sapporoensis]
MSYSSYLRPRSETISEEGIEGIIDLANLTSQNAKKIEADPELFFSLTYPTSDILKVIEQINVRFSTKKNSSGLFLFEGLKGSGKSHILLFIYNLFSHIDIAQKWLKRNNLNCVLPDDIVVIINKFTDIPYRYVWELIYKKLGKKAPDKIIHLSLPEFKEAIGDNKLILVLDELEQGIKVIADPAIQAQNIAFLQMISEFSNRSKQVTTFASIYGDREEPGSTLKRVKPFIVKFDSTKDQCNVILHRLFENYLEFNNESVSPVIDSYGNIWQKHISLDADELKNRFHETYPFSPSLIDVVLKKIPARGGFQNVRGALSFLGNLVKLTHSTNDIITPADASLEDKANIIMLRDLDIGGDLINSAIENMDELRSKIPIANRFASAVLLYSITGFESEKGCSRNKLLMDILSPGIDINAFDQAIMNFQKYASYFHTNGDRFFFDIEEQPEARVEYRSLHYKDAAKDFIIELVKSEIFRETSSTVVFESVEQTQRLLNDFEKNRLRYVITGRRLTREERHNIYYGMDVRNLILVLEPRDAEFQLLSDRDILKWATRVIAAKNLAEGTRNTSKKSDFERIARADQSFIIERIKRAGLVFVHWIKYGENARDDQIELEPLPKEFTKDKVLESLSQDFFPLLTIKEHLESRLEYIKEKSVKDIDAVYRTTLCFPIPAHVRAVSAAIRELCKEATIGIQHSRGNYCRRNPDLSETELFNAKIISPFSEQQPPSQAVPPQICPRCGQKTCECEEPPLPSIICQKCGQETCICPKKESISLKIPPKTSIGILREETASRLQQYQDADITTVVYKLFYQKTNIGDLSTLPGSIRGNLSGQGDVTAEIAITKTGRFSKSQIEQQIESLPSIPGADYSVDITLEVK